MKRIGESYKINTESFPLTSAVAGASMRYDMKDCRKLLACISLETSAGFAGGSQCALTINESSAFSATAASSNITGATAMVGSTAANLVQKARAAIINITTATTDGNTIVINGSTFTVSTAVAATSLLFGATAGSTAAGGADPIVTSLTSLINTYISGATASTLSTASILVQVDNEATSLNLQTSAASPISVLYRTAQAMVEIDQDRMSTNTRYLGIGLSTIATAISAGLTVIRTAGSTPSTVFGQYVTLTT